MKFIKSPILHFIVLGIALYFLYQSFRPADREVIEVTTQTIDALIQQYESISQMPVNDSIRQSLITSHIEDEILLREAYKRNFDKNDYRVRKRVLNIMRSSLTEVIPNPTNAQLRAYYEKNNEKFRLPPARSFIHVFFSFASQNMPADPEGFIQELNKTNNYAELGDYSLQGNKYLKASFSQIANMYGKPFAEVIFEMPIGIWKGPVESFQGIHYIQVTELVEPSLPSFESMENYLQDEYYFSKARELQQDKIIDLSRNYTFLVEGVERERL